MSATVDEGIGLAPLAIHRLPSGYAEQSETAPASVDQALVRGGVPLQTPLRHDLEHRFGYDFSDVRVHDDAAAHASAEEVNALAYTVGRHIVFGKGQYGPERSPGRRLLAHELAHVVQQRGENGLPRLQRQVSATGRASSSPWKTRGTVCGRATHENIDFPSTRISRVDIDLSSERLSLIWINPTGLSLPSGPFGISAGAGRCCLDCNDESTSQTGGSLCTPKGTWRVHNKGCVLSTATWARNPTYFSRAGIAIHAGPRPGHPASHGCVRTTEEASEIVHDNSTFSAAYGPDKASRRPDRRTEVVVSGTWDGPRCYPSSSSSRSVERRLRCAGAGSDSRLSPGSAPGAPDGTVAEPDRIAGAGPDGPGPA